MTSHKNTGFMKGIKMTFKIVSVLLLGLFSCQQTVRKKPPVPLDYPLEVVRFEQLFYESKPEELQSLKNLYPYFFPAQFPESVWVERLQDSVQIAVYQEVKHKFSKSDGLTKMIQEVLEQRKAYHPTARTPKVITLTSDLDYHAKIIDADSLLLLSLDNYLGANHSFYKDFPIYISKRLDPNFLMADIAKALAIRWVLPASNRTLLSQMVYWGKILYWASLVSPTLSDAQLMGYSEEELQWVIENEANIWRYFTEKKLLFDTDSDLRIRFIEEAPFTKFYLEIDQESPGRIGRWLGWQFVRAFAQKNVLPLPDILNLPADELFNKAGYKPPRK